MAKLNNNSLKESTEEKIPNQDPAFFQSDRTKEIMEQLKKDGITATAEDIETGSRKQLTDT